MFILLVKVVVFVMHLFLPILSVFVHGLMLALFAVSLRNQSTPDMSDPKNPSPNFSTLCFTLSEDHKEAKFLESSDFVK
jgi:hypothetical protein